MHTFINCTLWFWYSISSLWKCSSVDDNMAPGYQNSFSALIQNRNCLEFPSALQESTFLVPVSASCPQACRHRDGLVSWGVSHWDEEWKRRCRLWRFTCCCCCCCWSVSPVHEDASRLCILAADSAWIPFVAFLNAVFAMKGWSSSYISVIFTSDNFCIFMCHKLCFEHKTCLSNEAMNTHTLWGQINI